MGWWPGELELFVAVEHCPDAHELEPDDRVVLVVFDGVPLGRLERLGRWRLRRTYVQIEHVAALVVVAIVEVDAESLRRAAAYDTAHAHCATDRPL